MRKWFSLAVQAEVALSLVFMAVAGMTTVGVSGAAIIAASEGWPLPLVFGVLGVGLLAMVALQWVFLLRPLNARLNQQDEIVRRLDEHEAAHERLLQEYAETAAQRVAEIVAPKVVTIVETLVQRAVESAIPPASPPGTPSDDRP